MKPLVEALCVGQPEPFRGDEQSAFAKRPVNGPVRITSEGLSGDHQADRVHHGGVHMAVHLYPLVHHEFWREKLGGHQLLDLPGAFGTNLSVPQINEHDVYLGDRFRLGTALLEISQPRLPCWKIEHRFGRKAMVATIIQTGRSGWYFRVIEEGSAQAGQPLERVETNLSEWPVHRVFTAIVNPKADVTAAELSAMAQCEMLAPQWRAGALKKSATISG